MLYEIISRSEHQKENPNCIYLAKKKTYTNQLNLYEFLEIEKYRFTKENVILKHDYL
jgi:hypothetical protein